MLRFLNEEKIYDEIIKDSLKKYFSVTEKIRKDCSHDLFFRRVIENINSLQQFISYK